MELTKETLEKIQYCESISYCFFVCQNSKFLQSIYRPKDVFSSFDASGITTNGNKFIVEFKIRNYNACEWSGRTIIENSKLQALQVIWQQDKTFQVLYICYFNDVCLSFNLSRRFRQGGNSDILCTYDQPCKRSTYNETQQYTKLKKVNHLAFNPDMWHDQVIRY